MTIMVQLAYTLTLHSQAVVIESSPDTVTNRLLVNAETDKRAQIAVM